MQPQSWDKRGNLRASSIHGNTLELKYPHGGEKGTTVHCLKLDDCTINLVLKLLNKL